MGISAAVSAAAPFTPSDAGSLKTASPIPPFASTARVAGDPPAEAPPFAMLSDAPAHPQQQQAQQAHTQAQPQPSSPQLLQPRRGHMMATAQAFLDPTHAAQAAAAPASTHAQAPIAGGQACTATITKCTQRPLHARSPVQTVGTVGGYVAPQAVASAIPQHMAQPMAKNPSQVQPARSSPLTSTPPIAAAQPIPSPVLSQVPLTPTMAASPARPVASPIMPAHPRMMAPSAMPPGAAIPHAYATLPHVTHIASAQPVHHTMPAAAGLTVRGAAHLQQPYEMRVCSVEAPPVEVAAQAARPMMARRAAAAMGTAEVVVGAVLAAKAAPARDEEGSASRRQLLCLRRWRPPRLRLCNANLGDVCARSTAECICAGAPAAHITMRTGALHCVGKVSQPDGMSQTSFHEEIRELDCAWGWIPHNGQRTSTNRLCLPHMIMWLATRSSLPHMIMWLAGNWIVTTLVFSRRQWKGASSQVLQAASY